MSIKKHIPNFLTFLNLSCGIIAIVLAIHINVTYAIYFVLLATVFDFADGAAAKFLKAESKFGKIFDTLSDFVSFGLAPAIILFFFAQTKYSQSYVFYVPFLLTVFTALRLARFVSSEKTVNYFIGLPVPANALFWMGYVLYYQCTICKIGSNQWFFIALIFLFSLLMISKIKFASLKFENFSFKHNIMRYFFLTFSLILLLILGFKALVFIIFLYIIISVK